MATTQRTLTSIMGNSQRLDGGAMFGNAPKALWTRWIDVDEENRIPLCCRALLVEEPSGKRVLVETGIGAFFEPKMRDRFGVVESEHVLLRSLRERGLGHEDIDVVIEGVDGFEAAECDGGHHGVAHFAWARVFEL